MAAEEPPEPDLSTRRIDRGDRWGQGLAPGRDDDRAHALVRRFSLLVTAGPDAGKRFVSSSERAVAGTHRSAELVLTDPAAARFHCEIAVAGKLVALRDLDSGGGTLADGVSVLHAHLRGGSVLTIGRTQLRFDMGGEPVKVPLSERDRFGVMVGGSLAMRRAFAQLEHAAAGAAPVLLSGEPGTGKDSAARSIHLESERRDGPFVTLDCRAVAPARIEEELLRRALPAAAGGTLFLDEVAEIPLELQPRVAAALPPSGARVVAASRLDLRVEVNARRFRSVLYERLAGVEVRLPALRERVDDLHALVTSLLAGRGASGRPDAAPFSSRDLLVELARHAWPGNVRELAAFVARCLEARGATPPDDEGRRALEALLARHGGDLAAAAGEVGLARVHLAGLLGRRRGTP
jgi:two-component system response regulator GlrR